MREIRKLFTDQIERVKQHDGSNDEDWRIIWYSIFVFLQLTYFWYFGVRFYTEMCYLLIILPRLAPCNRNHSDTAIQNLARQRQHAAHYQLHFSTLSTVLNHIWQWSKIYTQAQSKTWIWKWAWTSAHRNCDTKLNNSRWNLVWANGLENRNVLQTGITIIIARMLPNIIRKWTGSCIICWCRSIRIGWDWRRIFCITLDRLRGIRLGIWARLSKMCRLISKGYKI